MFELLRQESGWLILVTLMLLAAATRGILREPQVRADLRRSLALWAGALTLHGLSRLLSSEQLTDARLYTQVGAYLLVAFGAVKAATGLLVFAVRTRAGLSTPKIVRDVIDGVLYLAAVATILQATLKLDLGGLLATSAVLSVVVGLALQETLGNLFAGLSVQMERPFEVGDWIDADGKSGQVVQVGWRATRIVTGRNEQITIPNAVLGKGSMTNFSRSSDGVGKDLLIEVDYDSPPNAVKAACLALLAAHPRVRKSPAPTFRISAWGASGIQYQVRFFCDRYEALAELTDELLSQLWYRLRREGFSIPFPTQTVYLHSGASAPAASERHRELAGLLGSVDFLAPLAVAEVERLADLARLGTFGAGERIIAEGEPGESFYLIVSGEVTVQVAAAGEVATLRRGDFFGEMSLLTGEVRSATVVARTDTAVLVVDRAAFGLLLNANAELAKALSDELARRRADLRSKAAGAEADAVGAFSAESNRILAKLRDIFRLR